jgi:hypothetical protein
MEPWTVMVDGWQCWASVEGGGQVCACMLGVRRGALGTVMVECLMGSGRLVMMALFWECFVVVGFRMAFGMNFRASFTHQD